MNFLACSTTFKRCSTYTSHSEIDGWCGCQTYCALRFRCSGHDHRLVTGIAPNIGLPKLRIAGFDFGKPFFPPFFGHKERGQRVSSFWSDSSLPHGIPDRSVQQAFEGSLGILKQPDSSQRHSAFISSASPVGGVTVGAEQHRDVMMC